MIRDILNLFYFFDKSHRFKILIFQSLLLISSIFEILSIFSIGPLVQLLSNPEIIYETDQFVSKVYNYFNFGSFEKFLIVIVIVILCFLFLSTIILTFTLYVLSMFSQTLGHIVRSSLFKFYISQNWIYHSRTNSSQNVEKIGFEANRVTQNIILTILLTNSKVLTGILIIISLTIYNPIASLICFSIFGIVYIIIFKFIKSKLSYHGLTQGSAMNEMYRIMSESFTGIKEAIIYGKQKKYFDSFFNSSYKFTNSSGKISFFQQAPRHTLEFFAIAVILSFILLLIYFGTSNFNEILPILSIYIFAGYKLLPILQNVYGGLVQIRANYPALIKIQNELTESRKYSLNKEEDREQFLKYENDLSIKFSDVSFFYKEPSLQAVKEINFEIKPNTVNYIIGSSGSGKSTILDLILGLIYPQKGKISVGEIKLNQTNSKFWHKNFGYVGQNVFLLDDTIKNNICFSNDDEEIDQKKLRRAIELSYIEPFLDDLSEGINTVVGERGIKLSGGQRQRVSIARALYQNKNILIFDEATSSLDGIAEKFITEQLKILSKSTTIIIVTHNVKLCRNADTIILLQNGMINEIGKYDDIKGNKLFLNLLNEK